MIDSVRNARPGTADTGVGTGSPAYRQRLLDAMAAALRERPYPELTIADVVRHAHTSRRTFYEQFTSKQDCLVALLRQSNERMIAGIAASVDPHADWRTQIRQAIEAWIHQVQLDPDLMLSWIRVVPSLGPDARQLMREATDAFAALIRDLSDTEDLRREGITPPPAQVTTILLGGLRELIATTVEDGGDVAGIVEVAVDVTTRILAPAGG